MKINEMYSKDMKILEIIPKNINSVIQKGPKLLACVRYGFQDLYIFVFF